MRRAAPYVAPRDWHREFEQRDRDEEFDICMALRCDTEGCVWCGGTAARRAMVARLKGKGEAQKIFGAKGKLNGMTVDD